MSVVLINFFVIIYACNVDRYLIFHLVTELNFFCAKWHVLVSACNTIYVRVHAQTCTRHVNAHANICARVCMASMQ